MLTWSQVSQYLHGPAVAFFDWQSNEAWFASVVEYVEYQKTGKQFFSNTVVAYRVVLWKNGVELRILPGFADATEWDSYFCTLEEFAEMAPYVLLSSVFSRPSTGDRDYEP